MKLTPEAKELKRKLARERMRKWRSKPENRQREKDREIERLNKLAEELQKKEEE